MCVMLHLVVHILTRILSTVSLCIRLKLDYIFSLSLSLSGNKSRKIALW